LRIFEMVGVPVSRKRYSVTKVRSREPKLVALKLYSTKQVRIGIEGLEGIVIIVMNSYIIGQFLSLIYGFYLLLSYYSTGICALSRGTALSSHEVITKYDSTFKG